MKFQTHVTQFFQQFLTRISFSDNNKVSDTVINRITKLCLSEEGGTTHYDDRICLFREDKINPTSGLRCILLLEFLLSQRLVFGD